MTVSMTMVVPSAPISVMIPPVLLLLTMSHSEGPLDEQTSMILAMPFFSSTMVTSPLQNMGPYFDLTCSGVIFCAICIPQ